MTYKPDFPRVRASRTCPMCGGPKLNGAVTCWECHNECELGAPARRANREAILAIAEELYTLATDTADRTEAGR